MVHSGFEASAVEEAFSSPRGMAAMIRASLFGPRVSPPPATPLPERAEREAPEEEALPTRGFEGAATPEVLRAAFAYRGDVTLGLADGSERVGYVANLRDDALELWGRGATSAEAVALAEIRRVAFTGRDAASGRSWETWLRKREKRKARAAAVLNPS